MNLKQAFVIFSLPIATLLGIAHADDVRVQDLAGKWEVVSVDRDGVHRHGEVGQQPGDVITIRLQADVAVGINPVLKNLFEGKISGEGAPAVKQISEIARPAKIARPANEGIPGFSVVFS